MYLHKNHGVKCERYGGGVSVYYKTCLKPNITVVKNQNLVLFG